ncbi:AMP-dependent synthetase [Flavilitoribacter nigricans DSM 23189 = NBRC 102662]|uniref:AMP-dependent synthetase n=1 Tax=Flavilitoribacter nigricans (strain ATCC 23147 / DSM 23189 / NBRC 102662 / NCIMB 1420 / SS-2) TaxID=1122177 RepID=A0A2D0NGF0_FLAN2|nr:AMP-dependent synthetase [Flavilitoribacter nigricans DSM 23189 = NBRC 102662]
MRQTDWAAKWGRYSPDKIAFKDHDTGRCLTYRQLNGLGNRLAGYLHRTYGIGKGDRIAILAENCLEYLVLFAVAQKTGCILVPLNYRLTGAEIDYLLKNATPCLVMGENKFLPTLEAAPAYQRIAHHWTMEELAAYCDPSSLTDQNQHFSPVVLDEDDPIFILYTSGTTGFPKGALYTHKMLFWNSINTAMSLIINSESRTVNCMPPFHTGGWNVLTTPFLHHGGYTCLIRKFDPATVLQLLERERTTIFMGVPTMLKMMADLPEFETADFSNLHYIIVGGESMPIPLIERWHQKGVPIRQGYGMTEVGPNLSSLHQDDAIRKKGSIGRPNFYVDIRVADDAGEAVSPGISGELLLRGPMVTPGYWQNPEATDKAMKDGWFCTGDRVSQDEEGYLYVVDRIKNMYISGGENVYPAEVERVLLSHPAVAEAAVVGVPDEQWGESGKAYIVRRIEAEFSEGQLLKHCQSNLAKFKVPKLLVLVDSLPKNDTGKIDRQALKNWN